MKGKLFLFPMTLSEDTQESVIPPQVKESIKKVRYFLCENPRTARRFISSLKVHGSIEALQFELLDKDTQPGQLAALMAPLLAGEDGGVMSESGCPGIADPGAIAVAYAHRNDIQVVPLVGPSSILMALMASGLNGQNFAFNGYLPIESQPAAQLIKAFERDSKEKKRTQIFIETPYRNNAVLGHLLKTLSGNTRLCIAADITGKAEWIKCDTVEQWRKESIVMEKVPSVFLFQAFS
jgi:16S rRNA (cytidine1402-2'-O)-methyltransferase